MNRQGALSGYRVLDLTDDKARLAARFLADMGAEVVRIDKPGAASFRWEDIGKQSATLDIASKAGQELFKRLVATADVLIEGHPPLYLDKLGLGYSELTKINPRLIMASVTTFGQDGPRRDYKADDLVAAAMGGQLYLNGEPGKPPLKLFGNQSYHLASLYTAIGVLLAIHHRHSSGKGQHLDISLQECTAAALDHVLVRHFYQDTIARRRSGLHWNGAFRVFPAKDGYVLLSLFYQWETLVEWLDDESMAADLADEEWRDREYRREHIGHVIEVVERWSRGHTVAELVEKGQLMRFPWAEVAPVERLLASPQLESRHFWVEAEVGGKKYKLPGSGL